jgi:hypothetical protein
MDPLVDAMATAYRFRLMIGIFSVTSKLRQPVGQTVTQAGFKPASIRSMQ